jgi:EpsI family protein
MQKLRKRYLILMGILLLFLFFSFNLLFNDSYNKVKVNIEKIPLVVGEWHGSEIPIDSNTKDILETENVLMREYRNTTGKKIIFTIVYYKDTRVALHLPESCLLGQGSRLVSRETEKIENNFFANKLMIGLNNVSKLMLYYFETINLRTSSYLGFRKQILFNKLRNESTCGALIRLNTDIENGNTDLAVSILKKFILDITPELDKNLFNASL